MPTYNQDDPGFLALYRRYRQQGLSDSDATALAQADYFEGGRDITRAQKSARKQALNLNRSNEEGKLRQLADTGIDTSFLTPEYLAAQERVTTDPIRREFSDARRQGFSQSLATGAPVGAFLNSLEGQEGRTLGDIGARNFLGNQEFGAGLASRRFGQNLDVAQFGENRRQFDEQLEARKREERSRRLGGIAGGIGGVLGLGASLLFPNKTPKDEPVSPTSPSASGYTTGANRAFGSSSLRLDDPRRRGLY